MAKFQQEQQYLSVSELVSLLDLTLQEYVGELVFTGEINQVSYAQSGHVYFSLKDEAGKIDAVMWQSTARVLKFKLEPGLAVVCQAKPNVYSRSGKLQMIVSRLEPFGAGLLQKKFNELKERLEREGLFDTNRKRKLPFLPGGVGIVTSQDGAAIHDIMHRFQARMPCLKTYLIDTRVQGSSAAEEIAAAVQRFNELSASGQCDIDVIIVTRGGGSLEDLWCFNEEIVVRAIFASKIPVVSAVGHETDFTLADFVADLRAPTPTAAAELVVPSSADLIARLASFAHRLAASDRWLQPAWQAVDELDYKLESAFKQLHSGWMLRLESLSSRIRGLQPLALLSIYSEQLQALQHRLNVAVASNVRLLNARLTAHGERLEAMNHHKLLQRGYALMQSKGKIVSSVSMLEPQDEVMITVSDGSVLAQIEEVHKH